MILYLDTSALLKVYLAEPHSDQIVQAVRRANALCTHIVTYAEMHAALARAARMARLSEGDRVFHASEFESLWRMLRVVAVDNPLVTRASKHAVDYGLRGYDSVQLAAAERAFEAMRRPRAFQFAAFDKELCNAAEALGMSLWLAEG